MLAMLIMEGTCKQIPFHSMYVEFEGFVMPPRRDHLCMLSRIFIGVSCWIWFVNWLLDKTL
jgi:hypothetical protein